MEGGKQLAVEPQVLAVNSRGDALMMGAHNFLFEPAAGGKWARSADHPVLGVLIPRGGEPRIVDSPVPGRPVNSVRAVARKDGTWAAVLAEVSSPTGAPRPDSAVRLWYGEFDGTRWTTVEQLPRPAGALRTLNASSLVEYGNTVALAVITATPDGFRNVTIFTRRGGQWSYESVPTLFTSYADLAYSDTLGLVLAVTQPDMTLPSDGNSLFLWGRGNGWKRLRKLVPSSRENVHHPRLVFSAAGGVLTWHAHVRTGSVVGTRAHAMVGHLESSEHFVNLDSTAARLSSVRFVSLPDSSRLWLLDTGVGNGEQREIRLVRDIAGSPAVIGRMPNPFVSSFAAAPVDSTLVLATGMIVDQEQGVIVSSLLRLELKCRPSDPAGSKASP